MLFSSVTQKAVALKKINTDLIPYVALLDPGCVITKNGNLVQTIRLKAFASDASMSNAIRDAIKNLNREDISVWVHTFRRKVNVALNWHETEDFSDILHESYVKHSPSFTNYVNEVYISLVSLPPKANFNKSIFNFITNTFNLAPKSVQKQFLNICSELSGIAETLISALKEFEAQKLYSNEEDSSFLTFLYLLVNFQNKQTSLSLFEISDYLSHKTSIAFGNNAFEIHSDNHKKVGAVIGIKEHKKLLDMSYIHELMNSNFEFIITEVMHFIKTSTAKDMFSHQSYLLNITHEEGFKDLPYFAEIYNASESKIEFCYHHIQIIPIAHTLEALEHHVKNVCILLSNMGLVFIRYDIALEKILWFRLPGNSPLTPKKRINHLNNICDFTEIYGYFSGLTKNLVWAHPLTVFFSPQDHIHIFNFHYKGSSGTTLMFSQANDPKKNILRNFLISESRKNKVKVLIFDHLNSSQVFVHALRGEYKSGLDSIKLNILSIQDLEILADIFYISSEQKLSIENARKLAKKLQHPTEGTNKVQEFLQYLDSSFNIPDSFLESDNIDWKKDTIGINLEPCSQDPKNYLIAIYSLVYKFIAAAKGQPFIISFDGQMSIINLFPVPILVKMLNDIASKAGVAIIAVDLENIDFNNLIIILEKCISTQFILPDFARREQYVIKFPSLKNNLTEIGYINSYNDLILLKQNNRSMILKFDMHNIIERNVLFCDKSTIALMQESISASDSDPKNWLPLYLDKFKD